ncbi:MAG: type II toxin-antitoxin system VapC family toxin [Pseudomonadota bacterium]
MSALLDTHVIIWLATADPSLGKRSHTLIDAAAQSGALAVSAISFWEIALLIEKGRLQTSLAAEELRNRLLHAGVVEVPLSGDIAVLATQLGLHADPADRFIAASAISRGATLLTADDRLLSWQHALKRHDARR